MVAVDHKITTNTTMLSYGKRLLYPLAASGAILRSECSRNLQHSATGARCLVAEYLYKGSPSCITDAFRQRRILHQSRYVQIFNRYTIEPSYDLIRRLMKKISSLIGDLQMFLCQYTHSFLSIPSATLLLRHLTLCNLQLALCLAEIPGILYDLASRKRGEALNADIKASRFAGSRNERALILLNREYTEPAVNLFLDSAGFDAAFNRTAQAKTNRADFREREFVANEFEARLRIGEAMVSISGFETGKAGILSFEASEKEGRVCAVYASQDILQNLRVNRAHIRALDFDFRKLKGLIEVADALACCSVSVASFLQCRVVKLAAKVESRIKLLRDALGRFQFVLVGFQVISYYMKGLSLSKRAGPYPR